jgi:plastocyanin
MTRLSRLLLLTAVLVVVLPGSPASAGGGCHEPPVADATGSVVKLVGFCITPTVLHVRPGTTVTWTNADPVTHNVWGAGWSRGDLEPGQSTTWAFDAAGTYPYACTLHPGMTGAIVVDAPATPVAAVRPASTSSSSPSSPDGGIAGSLAIGLLAVVALGGAFAAGTRVRRTNSDRTNSA